MLAHQRRAWADTESSPSEGGTSAAAEVAAPPIIQEARQELWGLWQQLPEEAYDRYSSVLDELAGISPSPSVVSHVMRLAREAADQEDT